MNYNNDKCWSYIKWPQDLKNLKYFFKRDDFPSDTKIRLYSEINNGRYVDKRSKQNDQLHIYLQVVSKIGFFSVRVDNVDLTIVYLDFPYIKEFSK